MKRFYLLTVLTAFFAFASASAQVRENVSEKMPSLAANLPKLSAKSVKKAKGVQKAQTRDVAADAEAIIWAVEGGKTNVLKYANGFTVDNEGYVVTAQTTLDTYVVFAENNEVYVRDIISSIPTGAYVKGTIDGNVITIPNCQPVYEELDDQNQKVTLVGYAQKMVMDEDGNLDFPEVDDIKLTLNDDGTLSYGVAGDDKQSDKEFIALTNGDGGFYGFGDVQFMTENVVWDAPALPDGIAMETYKMSYMGQNAVVSMGFDGDDVYVTNLPDMPGNIMLKGKKVGDNLEFDSQQFMGFNADKGYNTYLMVLDYPSQSDREKMEFTFNAANNTYTAAKQYVFFNTNRSYVDYMFIALQPKLTKWEAAAVAPANPTVDYVEEGMDKYDYSGALITLPTTDVNGDFIDLRNLYYNIYVDGELLALTKEEYTLLPVESMTDIPFAYEDGRDIQMFSEGQRLVFFFQKHVNTFGVQMLYHVGDQVMKSELVTWNNTTGIENVETDAQNAATCYDLTGRKLPTQHRGISIVRTADGKMRKLLVP